MPPSSVPSSPRPAAAADFGRPVEEQLAIVLAAAQRLPIVEVPLGEASGRTLAEPVRARVALPIWDNSAMDGFAVRYADVAHASVQHPIRLRVVADVPAGSADDPAIGAAEAARIMTGAPMPSAADTVVPLEDTRDGLDGSLEAAVVEHPPRERGRHVRRRADDVVLGDVVVEPGVALGPLQLSAAAACGATHVRVARAPRVAVISTGSELAPLGEPLRRGQIPESNSHLLAGLVTSAGAVVTMRATVDDDGGRFAAAIADAVDAGSDVIVTSGGVGAGAFEVVRTVLTGSDVEFTRVAMQPGRPQAFGRVAAGALLFGLPGNPISSVVSFEVFVRPALLAMQGRADRERPLLKVPVTAGWRSHPGKRQYVPARVDRSDPARWRVAPVSAASPGSHRVAALAGADAWIVVPTGVSEVASGALVDVMLIA